MKIHSFIAAICFAALPVCAQMLDPALLTKPATDAWPTYNGDYSGRRFSTLNQINQSNVKHLTLVMDFSCEGREHARLDCWRRRARLPRARLPIPMCGPSRQLR